jgi:hypothetical protein
MAFLRVVVPLTLFTYCVIRDLLYLKLRRGKALFDINLFYMES